MDVQPSGRVTLLKAVTVHEDDCDAAASAVTVAVEEPKLKTPDAPEPDEPEPVELELEDSELELPLVGVSVCVVGIERAGEKLEALVPEPVDLVLPAGAALVIDELGPEPTAGTGVELEPEATAAGDEPVAEEPLPVDVPDEVDELAAGTGFVPNWLQPVMGLLPGSFSKTPVMVSGYGFAMLQEVEGSLTPPMSPGHLSIPLSPASQLSMICCKVATSHPETFSD